MDDFLLPPPNDHLDCLVEVYMLKEEARMLSDEILVEYVSETSRDIEINIDSENAMASFFNTGKLSLYNRKILENCYILIKNYLCVSEDGEICHTLVIN